MNAWDIWDSHICSLRIYAHSLVVASEVLEEASKKIEELYYMEGIPYTSVLASLMCAMVGTCPDIAYAVSLVSRFTKPTIFLRCVKVSDPRQCLRKNDTDKCD